MARHPQLLDWLFLSVLVVTWGSSFAMTKIAVAQLDAAWIAALRLAIAAVVLVPYAYAAGQPLHSPLASWKKFSLLGLIGHAAPFFLISWGTGFVSSSVAGLLMGAIPLILIVLAHFFMPGEPLTLTKSLGFLSGFAGIVILIGPASLLDMSFTGHELIGEAAILGGCFCYAIHAITAKRLGIEHPIRQTSAVCLAGAFMAVIFAALHRPDGLDHAPAAALWAVVGLGLFPTAFASLLLYHLLDRSGPTFVAYSNYLVPVFAVLLGAAALGESLSLNILAALALILAGIAISRWQARSTKETPA
ncbi:MAG: DMT family transporter [Alphaproteobacteria bacterium]|nr:DMT family transporter [Alphaproteobacteria bacterium]